MVIYQKWVEETENVRKRNIDKLEDFFSKPDSLRVPVEQEPLPPFPG